MADATVLTPVAPALRPAVTMVVSDGRRVGLSPGAVREASDALRGLGATWCGPRRAWILKQPEYASSLATQLEHALRSVPLLDVAGLAADLRRALEHPQPHYFTEILDLQILPLTSGEHAVSSLYDSFVVDAMRGIGARFHRPASAWVARAGPDVILAALASVAGVAATEVYVHERSMHLEDLAGKTKSELPIKVEGAAPAFAGAKPADGAEDGRGFLSTICSPLTRIPVDEDLLERAVRFAGLYDYQAAGVRHLLSRSAALLGDDMGLGKTRQAVVAARLAAGRRRILVVCPASLRINLEREIHAVFAKDVVGMVGEDRLATLFGCRWVIANYERLGGLVREADLEFEVMVVDEAHFLKEHKAGRTRNAFILADRIPRRFLLTGTPILSREIEVHTLLRISGHPVGQLELVDFRKQYAGGAEQRQALATVLSDWMLRRPKSVLKNLGAKTRQLRYVSPPGGLEDYKALLQDMSLAVMPKIVKLRQWLEAAKIDFVLDTVRSLGDDDKLIVFCEYMESVKTMADALAAEGIGAVSLVGADAMAKRQAAVDRFQQDPGCRVFIGSTSAAGVGITLTAANYVTFASLPWTPALQRQAEDRAYRNGQRRDVIVLLPIIAETIDEQILALLESKTELEQDVVESAVRARLSAGMRVPA